MRFFSSLLAGSKTITIKFAHVRRKLYVVTAAVLKLRELDAR